MPQTPQADDSKTQRQVCWVENPSA